MSNEYWPLFDLRIRTPRLELRYPTDDDLVLLAGLAAEGIHDADTMPFSVPWSRAAPPQLERGLLQHAWSRRAELSPDRWSLPFVVRENARPVGVQDLFASQFPVTRSVETGSWLVHHAQGRGIGTEMRAAVLHLAFEGLGAAEAHSASFEDNHRSEAVSRANGYEANGSVLVDREGKAARTLRWILTRDRWSELRRDGIDLYGVRECRTLLGAGHDDSGS